MACPTALDILLPPPSFRLHFEVPTDNTGTPERKYVFQRVATPTNSPRPAGKSGGVCLLFLPVSGTTPNLHQHRRPRFIGQEGFITSIDGEVDTFYRQNITGMVKDRQVAGFRSAYLEIAHQFPNGIRLSGGLLGVLRWQQELPSGRSAVF